MEMIHHDFRATSCYTMYVHVTPVHVVTDAKSLYDVVVLSSLPSDARAAIEVLCFREIISPQACSNEDSEDERLPEPSFEKHFHWCSSAEQKADIGTKSSTTTARMLYKSDLNQIVVTPYVSVKKSGPSRPTVQITKEFRDLQRQRIAESEEAREKLGGQ